MTAAIAFIVALPIAILGFAILSRWHSRWAWRRAHEETVRDFKARGKWPPP